jgi:hypothetical protein
VAAGPNAATELPYEALVRVGYAGVAPNPRFTYCLNAAFRYKAFGPGGSFRKERLGAVSASVYACRSDALGVGPVVVRALGTAGAGNNRSDA